MPYITDDAKIELQSRAPENAGELTYEIQQLLLSYLEGQGLRYAQLAECLGALEGARLDLINRVIAPYEDKKCRENGDVWPRSLLSEPSSTR